MTGRPKQQRPPAETPAGGAAEAVDYACEVAQLRAELVELREQVEEHQAVLANRIERHRRRAQHPRLYPQ